MSDTLTTLIITCPTAQSHHALPFSSTPLSLPALPPPSTVVSVVSTPGRRLYVATKGGVSGNKKTVGRINLSPPLPTPPGSSTSPCQLSASKAPTPSFSSPPISASPITTSLHLPSTSTDYYVTGHADSSLTIYNTLTGEGNVVPLRGIYRGITNLTSATTHTNSPVLLGSSGDGSLFYLPFWGLETAAADLVSCYVGGLCSSICGYRNGFVAVCDGILYSLARTWEKEKLVLTSSPYPLPRSTPVSALHVVGVEELIVGYKDGRIEYGGEGIGWGLVREGGKDGEEVRQLLSTSTAILALTNSSITQLTIPDEENSASSQLSLLPVPPCSRMVLVTGRHGGREAKLDRWAVEGGIENKILGGGFKRGSEEICTWEYATKLPSPQPVESSQSASNSEVEALKMQLKEKERECERWAEVNRKLVKRLKKK